MIIGFQKQHRDGQSHEQQSEDDSGDDRE